jgi:isopenicillin N synthase-like dioxygenase
LHLTQTPLTYNYITFKSIMALKNSTESKFIIPTVDVSAYLADPDSAEAKAIVSEIRHACKTSGFFQIINHGIPSSLQKKVLDSAVRLFDLPLDEKLKLQSAKGRGYEVIGSQALQPGTNPDLKEVSLMECIFWWKEKQLIKRRDSS